MAFESAQPPPGGEQTEKQLNLLIETGLLLASERSLDAIVQTALDAGLHLCGARFGAFFYNPAEDRNPPEVPTQPYCFFKVAGPDIDIFQSLLHPRPTGLFSISFLGQRILRSNDITQDPIYGRNPPFAGIPPGLPVRSCLGVPVRNRSGYLLGCMLYGHPQPGIFTVASEHLVATIASQAAIAIDNVLLSQSLSHEISLVESARALQRHTADRLRQALDAAQLGTWTWNRATDHLDLDERAASLLHAQPHSPIPRAALRRYFVAVADQACTASSLQHLLQSGGMYRAELCIDSPEGIQTWIAVRGMASFAPDTSRITGMIGTVQDITAHKIQEAALRQSEKLAATGRLAASIAHEINNPLEAVTNLIYLARTDAAAPPSIRLLLEAADTEIARVSQIAQQTLGFYRDTTHPIEMDLNELLHGVVDLFARKMASRKILCTLDLDPCLRIHGLRGEVRQVFSNLIVNAIEAFPSTSTLRPGRIHIRGRYLQGQGKISILISDQGSGIPAPARPRLFTPFFTTKRSIGTGLGLWVTRGFVEKHGGSIHYRTRTDTPSGTIFRIVFPVWMRPAASPSEARADSPAVSFSPGLNPLPTPPPLLT